MARHDAMQETFEEVTILNRPALFTSVRINPDTVPKGLYLYEVRHDDDSQGDPVQIAAHIMVNHWGSVILRDSLPLPADGYLDINPDNDWNYGTGNCQTVIEYLQKYPTVNSIGYFIATHSTATLDILTPNGFVYLSPEESDAILNGESIIAHAGVNGTERRIMAKELLTQEILQFNPDDNINNLFHAMSGYIPDKYLQNEEKDISLNTLLYKKLFAEQEDYRNNLLSLSPQEVLNHAYEYTLREDILFSFEENDLDSDIVKALLKTNFSLADIFKDFEKRESSHMEEIWDTVQSRADSIVKNQSKKKDDMSR